MEHAMPITTAPLISILLVAVATILASQVWLTTNMDTTWSTARVADKMNTAKAWAMSFQYY